MYLQPVNSIQLPKQTPSRAHFENEPPQKSGLTECLRQVNCVRGAGGFFGKIIIFNRSMLISSLQDLLP